MILHSLNLKADIQAKHFKQQSSVLGGRDRELDPNPTSTHKPHTLQENFRPNQASCHILMEVKLTLLHDNKCHRQWDRASSLDLGTHVLLAPLQLICGKALS